MQGLIQLATKKRVRVPNTVCVEQVDANIAGLGTVVWRDPIWHASLLDYAPAGRQPAKREQPLN